MFKRPRALVAILGYALELKERRVYCYCITRAHMSSQQAENTTDFTPSQIEEVANALCGVSGPPSTPKRKSETEPVCPDAPKKPKSELSASAGNLAPARLAVRSLHADRILALLATFPKDCQPVNTLSHVLKDGGLWSTHDLKTMINHLIGEIAVSAHVETRDNSLRELLLIGACCCASGPDDRQRFRQIIELSNNAKGDVNNLGDKVRKSIGKEIIITWTNVDQQKRIVSVLKRLGELFKGAFTPLVFWDNKFIWESVDACIAGVTQL